MRLSQVEQVILLQAAEKHPGPLADWLRKWVDTQGNVGPGSTFRITDIPIPEPVPEADVIHMPPQPIIHGVQTGRIYASKDTRQEMRDRRKRILDSVEVETLPPWQRKAAKKHIDATIKVVEETDRLPDSKDCWIGDHQIEGWEGTDVYLWRIEGTWESGRELRKWGCEDCARLIHRTHPESQIHAF